MIHDRNAIREWYAGMHQTGKHLILEATQFEHKAITCTTDIAPTPTQHRRNGRFTDSIVHIRYETALPLAEMLTAIHALTLETSELLADASIATTHHYKRDDRYNFMPIGHSTERVFVLSDHLPMISVISTHAVACIRNDFDSTRGYDASRNGWSTLWRTFGNQDVNFVALANHALALVA